ncbi:MAG: hypothetical protein M3Y49_20925, partial [Actinomycetota bacterium]|nr:hypothetical protein [Actinomycetota bacterium]
IGRLLGLYTVMYVVAFPVMGAFGFHAFWEKLVAIAVTGVVIFLILRFVQHHPVKPDAHT